MTLHPNGTRIRLFPELFAGYAQPETVWLSPPPGTVLPGPADTQFTTVNPGHKTQPYAPPAYMPPFPGPHYPAASPDRDGHFDHLPMDSQQFLAAHLYGAARHTMDIWEHYLRRRVTWWHAPSIPRLELVPVVLDWPNAHSGPGFLETGTILNDQGQKHLFCMNFDVVAHEVAHAVLFATVGVPAPGRMTAAYLGFHECFADLFGLVGVLRFGSVANRLLAQTGGNLHALNMVNQLGRYSDNEQIRLASNAATMADLAGVDLLPDGSWSDPSGRARNQHALSEPLTGAIFDVLVEIFQDGLRSRGLIAAGMDSRDLPPHAVARHLPTLHDHHQNRLTHHLGGYEAALRDARDVVGFGMAHAIETLHPETLSFGRVAARLIEAAALMGEASNLPAIAGLFLKRGIDPAPFLTHAGGRLRFEDRQPSPPRTHASAAYLAAHRQVRHGHK